ncbi:unnamed protein product [Lampetra fluviatilis]
MEKGGRGEVGSASTMEAAVLIALLYALLAHELVSGLVARRVLASKPACKPVRPIWSEEYVHPMNINIININIITT